MKFGEIVPDASLIMGAKAVFGPISSHVLCFGSRGDQGSQAYYSKPRSAARHAVLEPWVICIGGGRMVRDRLGGKVLNVARVSYDYGDTASFVGPDEAQRLARWPVAVVLDDVWSVDGFPHLITDLGLSDRRVLENAMDGIIRHDDRIVELHDRLFEWDLSSVSARLPSNFLPATTPRLRAQNESLAVPSVQSQEGKTLWVLQKQKESSPALKRESKRLNAERNGGRFTCEACGFVSSDAALFDCHHPLPLAAGVRITLAEHLIVLCPTCHRKAHRKNGNPLDPFTLSELILWNEGGRIEIPFLQHTK